MIFRNLDVNSDWTFGSGVNNYATQDDAIALNIRTRILSWLNDCFFAQNAGVDWLNRLGSKGEQALLEADIRRIIIQSFGVTSLDTLNIELINRNLSVEYGIKTIYSPSYQAQIQAGI